MPPASRSRPRRRFLRVDGPRPVVVALFAGFALALAGFVLALVLVALPGCRRSPAPPIGAPTASSGSGAVSSSAATSPALPVPDLSPETPMPNPWAGDELWKSAREGDAVDLTRLAQREGAAGLLAGVETGGQVALVALAALPEADDAELVLGRLCTLAAAVRPERAPVVLAAVRGILAAPRRQAERYDGAGLVHCRVVLKNLVTDQRLAPGARDVAASALQSLDWEP